MLSWLPLKVSIKWKKEACLSVSPDPYQTEPKSPFVAADQLNTKCCWWVLCFYHLTCCKLVVLCNQSSGSIVSSSVPSQCQSKPTSAVLCLLSLHQCFIPTSCQHFTARNKLSYRKTHKYEYDKSHLLTVTQAFSLKINNNKCAHPNSEDKFTSVWYQITADFCKTPLTANTHIHSSATPPPSEHFSWDYLHTWGLRAQCLRDGRGRKAFACWQQQQQRHSDTSLQPTGRTRLNPAGSRVCRETHWPGIWDVRLTLLNHSLETMSIRATPSSLFDIKAKEGGGGEDRRERGRRRMAGERS